MNYLHHNHQCGRHLAVGGWPGQKGGLLLLSKYSISHYPATSTFLKVAIFKHHQRKQNLDCQSYLKIANDFRLSVNQVKLLLKGLSKLCFWQDNSAEPQDDEAELQDNVAELQDNEAEL